MYNILIIIETFSRHVISHLFLTRFKIDERKKFLVPVEKGKTEEGIRCNHLGRAYDDIGQSKTAIKYHQRVLEIAKEVGDKAGEGTGYDNLGCTYLSLGQFKTAIEYQQRGLEIAKEVGDKAAFVSP